MKKYLQEQTENNQKSQYFLSNRECIISSAIVS